MILDFLFPKYCLRCNSLRRYICRDCRDYIQFHTVDVCPGCFSTLLIDDIFTSGTTANELARLIKEAESKEVYLFSLAHGSTT